MQKAELLNLLYTDNKSVTKMQRRKILEHETNNDECTIEKDGYKIDVIPISKF